MYMSMYRYMCTQYLQPLYIIGHDLFGGRARGLVGPWDRGRAGPVAGLWAVGPPVMGKARDAAASMLAMLTLLPEGQILCVGYKANDSGLNIRACRSSEVSEVTRC